MKKICMSALILTLAISLFSGCNANPKPVSQPSNSPITVITREEGSGTRDAFVELTGVLEKVDGKKTDRTTEEAVSIDGTQAVMSNVTGNESAIGYISLGSLNSSVKAISVDGIEPNAQTVKSGEYPIARPFNIATKGDLSELATHFIAYLLSADGQAVIEKNGYVSAVEGKAAPLGSPAGKLVIAGSSSVSPVMEKLKEAYEAVNPNAKIEIQTSDSSAGMTAAMEGTCDIGMASRALKDQETTVLKSTTIAMDGIAVIVNTANPITGLAMDQVRDIFLGAITNWGQVSVK